MLKATEKAWKTFYSLELGSSQGVRKFIKNLCYNLVK